MKKVIGTFLFAILAVGIQGVMAQESGSYKNGLERFEDPYHAPGQPYAETQYYETYKYVSGESDALPIENGQTVVVEFVSPSLDQEDPVRCELKIQAGYASPCSDGFKYEAYYSEDGDVIVVSEDDEDPVVVDEAFLKQGSQ